MDLFTSNNIIVQVEDRDYHIELFNFNNIEEVKEFYNYSLSEYKILDIRYFDGSKYINANVRDLL